jgi:hypothetical protein
MSVLRIRKRLDEPIPQLPELTPLVGRTVEIIVLEGSDSGSSEHIADTETPARFDDLLGGWPEDERADGFEEAVRELRRRPWTRSAG